MGARGGRRNKEEGKKGMNWKVVKGEGEGEREGGRGKKEEERKRE